MTDSNDLSYQSAAHAHHLGFDAVAIAPCSRPSTQQHYRSWLQLGYHGEMAYLARPDAIAKRGDLHRVLEGTRTIICVAANYHVANLPSELRDNPSRGIISRYAVRSDYHDTLIARLDEIADSLRAQMQEPVALRTYVDTGPLLERDLAAQAGLGFVGRNTNLIIPGLGSWCFLGEILLTADLSSLRSFSETRTEPHLTAEGTCGRCTRCLDACPTGALVAPYLLDARRCISYLTIELKGPIPRRLRSEIGNHVFGCDICQDVCPWNKRFASPTSDPAFRAPKSSFAPALLEMMMLSDQEFRARYGGSSLERTKRRGLLRNVAVALGNWGDPTAVPVLRRALADSEPLVRGHAAWALSRIGTSAARQAVRDANLSERDPWVRNELEDGLQQLASPGQDLDQDKGDA